MTDAVSDNALREARALLGFSNDEDLSPAAIKAAFRSKARQHHPDTGGDPDVFRGVTSAARILQQHPEPPAPTIKASRPLDDILNRTGGSARRGRPVRNMDDVLDAMRVAGNLFGETAAGAVRDEAVRNGSWDPAQSARDAFADVAWSVDQTLEGPSRIVVRNLPAGAEVAASVAGVVVSLPDVGSLSIDHRGNRRIDSA